MTGFSQKLHFTVLPLFSGSHKKLLKKIVTKFAGGLMHKLSMIPSKNELDLMNDVDFVDKTEDPVLSE